MSNRKNNVLKKRELESKAVESGKYMEKRDYISMGILTFIFAILVFINLGNAYAPSSGEKFTQDSNHDVIIDLGDYIDIASVDIFLGNIESRNVALSAYNEVTKEWEIINSTAEIKSVFAWNEISVNYNLRYLGLVFTDREAVINEIVCKAPDGSVITPVNTDQYPSLFDEQDMHPEYKTYMDQTMFDEVYHGRAGYEILNGIEIYETTHPHFGKELIALGISIFGMTPFGWRFAVALLGIFMVPVMYLFAKRLTKDFFISTCTTTLLVFDFMHFGLSRIATIDIPVALFILLMYYFMYSYIDHPNKESRSAYIMLILSGVAMSFGVATKFTGIYAGAGLGIIFIGHLITHFSKKTWKKLMCICISFFIIVPFTIYTLAFAPVKTVSNAKNIFEKMFVATKNMVDYHANLKATHFYSSPWYTWPIDGKPLLTSHEHVGDKISSISIMGNPIIWWIILPCLLFMIYRVFKKKDTKALFLLISYLAQYVPWMLVSRCIFIYHYFPASLFGMLMIGYTFKIITEKYKKAGPYIIGYLVAVIILFIIFYPAISGMPVKQSYLEGLKWLPQWIITF